MDLVLARGDLERIFLDHRDDRHGAAAAIGAVGAEAVVHLVRHFGVFETNRVLLAMAMAGDVNRMCVHGMSP